MEATWCVGPCLSLIMIAYQDSNSPCSRPRTIRWGTPTLGREHCREHHAPRLIGLASMTIPDIEYDIIMRSESWIHLYAPSSPATRSIVPVTKPLTGTLIIFLLWTVVRQHIPKSMLSCKSISWLSWICRSCLISGWQLVSTGSSDAWLGLTNRKQCMARSYPINYPLHNMWIVEISAIITVHNNSDASRWVSSFFSKSAQRDSFEDWGHL